MARKSKGNVIVGEQTGQAALPPEPSTDHIWHLGADGSVCTRCNVVLGSFASEQTCPGKEWCE